MRKIKFRIWLTNKYPHKSDYSNAMIYPEFVQIDNKNKWIHWGSDSVLEGGARLGTEAILMQLTGIEDSTNKEVYESDIVDLHDNDSKMLKSTHRYCVIEWDEPIDGWTGWGMAYVPTQGKIVGNIYENPELIKRPLRKDIKRLLEI